LDRDDGGGDAAVSRADGRRPLAGRAAPARARPLRRLGRDRRVRRGYLLTWTAFGLVAFALFELVRSFDVDALSWDSGGQYVAAAVIAIAAGYELTPLKDVCLSKCRSPLAFVVGSWRDGRGGAARMGMEQGSWCVGCCWLAMGALFALGVMSVGWMAVIAGLIAVEKLLPWARIATLGVAAALGCLAASVALGVV
jgi:predicted metal-binding membrane protein